MKIAQVTGFFMPEKYGSNELFLCRELSKRGHEVTVFTASEPRQEYAMLKDDSNKNKIELFENFKINRFSSKLRVRDIQLMPMLFQSLISEEFDIIHAHEFFSPSSFYGSLASTLKHVPFVITQHNDQFPTSFLNKYLYYIDSFTAGQFTLRRAKKTIALSRAIRSHLLHFQISDDKITVIPNAIDTDVFTPNKQNFLKEKWNLTSPIILFVGRFSAVKGVTYLMEAFPKILKAIPEAKLVLIGGGPLENKLKIYEKTFKDHIFFIPFVPNDVMPNIYAGCDVVVLPSLEERFGNVVLEAMACGKPVIGSCIGGMLDTIAHEETGLHIQPRNSNQIADSVIKILKNDSLKEKFGNNARLRVLKYFSSEVVVKSVEALYYNSLSD